MRAIDSATHIEKVRVKANSKFWFDSEVIYTIQKKDKLYSRQKKSGLEADKDKFKSSKLFLQKMLHRKKNSYFEVSWLKC